MSFFEKINQLFGKEQVEKMKVQFAQPLMSTARIHPRRQQLIGLSQYFRNDQYRYDIQQNLLFIEQNEKRAFTLHPLFFGGYYYFQEYASMQAVKALNIQKGDFVLDLCASPGSKSTQILELLNETGFLICNEIDKNRTARLIDNIIRWGYSNVMVVSQRIAKFKERGEIFDKILVDAPCSGEGMFHKFPNMIDSWSQDRVDQCAKIQKNILRDSICALKEGGICVYSTCTYSPEENEEVVEFILQEYSDVLELVPLHLGGTAGLSSYQGKHYSFNHEDVERFILGETLGEGFFIACFRKKKSLYSQKREFMSYIRKQEIQFSYHKLEPLIREFQLHSFSLQSFFQKGNHLFLLYTKHYRLDDLYQWVEWLSPLYLGIPVFKIKGDQAYPHYGIALNLGLSQKWDSQFYYFLNIQEIYDLLIYEKKKISNTLNSKGIKIGALDHILLFPLSLYSNHLKIFASPHLSMICKKSKINRR